MIAHVNKEQVVLRFHSRDNLPREEWELLLDELKAHHIAGLHFKGKRSYADLAGDEELGSHRVFIQLTSETVTMAEAIAILKRRHIEIATHSG
jgi:hypothetical protein